MSHIASSDDTSNKSFKISLVINIILLLCLFYWFGSVNKNSSYFIKSKSIFNESKTTSQAGLLRNSTIHIISVSDKNASIHYQHHSKTLWCYAHRHHYHYSVIDPNDYYTCSSMVDFFFRKHCAVMSYLIQNIYIEWLLVLDGDTFVANASKSLESYLPNDTNIHIIHYERMWYNEIAAGNYLVRNHPWSILYLDKWVEFYKKMPAVSFNNHDNGVIHLHFLDMVGKLDAHTYRTCYGLYKNSSGWVPYMKYVACCKCALKGQRRFTNIILHRKGHSFCRDSQLPDDSIYPNDFLIHGYKNDLNYFFKQPIDTATCTNDSQWTPKIRPSRIITDLSIIKNRIKKWELLASKQFPTIIMYPEIADCWPNCSPDITGTDLEKYNAALCKYGLKL